MSTPFHDLADQYDALTVQLRALGDDYALGNLEHPPAEEAPDTDKPGAGPKSK